MKKSKIMLTIISLISFALFAAACSAQPQIEESESGQKVINEKTLSENINFEDSPYLAEDSLKTQPPTQIKPEEPETPPQPLGKTTLNISAVGDIMMHKPQVESAAAGDGSFDFKPVFEYIKPYIESADLALGNIETTVSTLEKGFYGFPRFRSPKEVIEALKYAGFDVITTSNNHILDGFEFGLEHTLNTLDEFGLLHTGAARTPEERESILIIDKNNIKVAILAYTYGTNGMEAAVDSERLRYMVIYLDETDRILNDVRRAREKGADIVIACLHWGHEYHREQSPQQEELAETLITAGVDIIFGSHPHVLQPIVRKTVETEDAGQKEGLVVYSMGNFVSNQRKRFRDSGMIVNVTVVKDHDLGKAYIGDVTYVPTWVNRYSADGKLHYRILPVGVALDTGLYKDTHERLAQVWSETTGHIGDFEPIR